MRPAPCRWTKLFQHRYADGRRPAPNYCSCCLSSLTEPISIKTQLCSTCRAEPFHQQPPPITARSGWAQP